MGIIQKIKRIAKIFVPLTLFTAIGIGIVGIALWDFNTEVKTAQNNPEKIYKELEIENVEELVEIKKSKDDSGYYLDFVEDFDKKIEKIVKDSNKYNGLHNMPDGSEFLKKIIKAEVVTQFPNLGGNIPEGSNGFQGAIDIRRITPNKEIGSVEDNPGRGPTTTVEKDEVGYSDSEITPDEEVVKTWQKGQTMLIKGNATVYEQEESELEERSRHWILV